MESFSILEDQVELARGAWAAVSPIGSRWRGKRILVAEPGPLPPLSLSRFHSGRLRRHFRESGGPPPPQFHLGGPGEVRCLFPILRGEIEKGTYNFYVNETFQGRAPGRILTTGVESRRTETGSPENPAEPSVAGPVEWAAERGRVLLNETRTLDVVPARGEPHRCPFPASRPAGGDSIWARPGMGLFGVRLVEALSVTHGGRLVDSEGREGGREISRGKAGWVDGSGTLGRGVGRARLCSPIPPPPVILVRDPTGEPCPSIHGGLRWSLGPEDGIEFGIRVVVHDGDAGEARVGEALPGVSGRIRKGNLMRIVRYRGRGPDSLWNPGSGGP